MKGRYILLRPELSFLFDKPGLAASDGEQSVMLLLLTLY